MMRVIRIEMNEDNQAAIVKAALKAGWLPKDILRIGSEKINDYYFEKINEIGETFEILINKEESLLDQLMTEDCKIYWKEYDRVLKGLKQKIR